MFANNNNSSIDKGIIRSLNNDIIILLISLAVMMAIGKYVLILKHVYLLLYLKNDLWLSKYFVLI